MTAPRTLLPEDIAREIALDLPDGSYVNLGIGLPGLVARFVPSDREVVIHCENGVAFAAYRSHEAVADSAIVFHDQQPDPRPFFDRQCEKYLAHLLDGF